MDASRLVPNCLFIQEQARKINDLNITWYENRLAANERRSDQNSADLTRVTSALSDTILRQAFMTELPDSQSEQVENILGSLAFNFGVVDQKLLQMDTDHARRMLAIFYASRLRIEARIEKHKAHWHMHGREQCYRRSDHDSLPIYAVAIARRAGDILLRRR